jgi:transcription elongation factor GreB
MPERKESKRRSPYITPAGLRTLEAEAHELWRRRREVVVHLSAAAAEGDRSENAEYIYRKKQLRELDWRIRYLQKRLPELEVVTRRADSATDRVYFGASVELENEQAESVIYRIVGSDELAPERGWISIDSPVAKALLRRQVDDEVTVHTPSGDKTYWITAISYGAD